MVVTWDDRIVPRLIGGPELRGLTKSGGRSNSGDEQRSFFGPGRWEIRYEIPIHTRAKVLAWRSMMDRLRAGEEILVKVYDMHRAKGVVDSAEKASRVVATVAVGATSMQIDATGIDLEPGVLFSIGQRLYRINQVTAETTSTSLVDIVVSDDKILTTTATWPATPTGGSRYTVNFLPPLRVAASTGDTVEFTDLVCLCVPADLSDGDLSLDLGRFGNPSITFRET